MKTTGKMINRMLLRAFNIIQRAATDFDMEVYLSDKIGDAYESATNVIGNNVDYDMIRTCEMSNHFSHLSWQDPSLFDGQSLEVDGEFISQDHQHNRYFILTDNGWQEITYHDACKFGVGFVAVHSVINDFGRKILLVAPINV